jgi:EAL domain-containing protein (putative c-di-GMP-specific phosphodiesterase class I)
MSFASPGTGGRVHGAPETDGRAQATQRAASARVVRGLLDDPLRLTPVFQPILDIVSGRIVGFEALARLTTDPGHAPVRMFSQAHRLGLGARVEGLAVARALDVAAESGIPADTFISVNVSPLVLGHPDVLAALRSRDLRDVVIELTEEDAVDDYRALRRVMRRYLDRGARFAIDDAGAGFASMRHLTELWPTFFKLDALLTRGLGRDGRRQALVRALAILATDVGATLIVEGVESTLDLTHLTRTRLPLLVQGYAIARPGRPWPSVSRQAARATENAAAAASARR